MAHFQMLLGVTAACAVMASAMSAGAAPKRSADKRAMLAAICEKGQIRKGACRKARGYPEGRSCDIALTGEGGEGRFSVRTPFMSWRPTPAAASHMRTIGAGR